MQRDYPMEGMSKRDLGCAPPDPPANAVSRLNKEHGEVVGSLRTALEKTEEIRTSLFGPFPKPEKDGLETVPVPGIFGAFEGAAEIEMRLASRIHEHLNFILNQIS
jgi:hypothetical protein